MRRERCPASSSSSSAPTSSRRQPRSVLTSGSGAPRRIERIVRAQRADGAEPEVRTLQGWRRELVGAELLELLAGRRSLRIGEDRRLAVEVPRGEEVA